MRAAADADEAEVARLTAQRAEYEATVAAAGEGSDPDALLAAQRAQLGLARVARALAEPRTGKLGLDAAQRELDRLWERFEAVRALLLTGPAYSREPGHDEDLRDARRRAHTYGPSVHPEPVPYAELRLALHDLAGL